MGTHSASRCEAPPPSIILFDPCPKSSRRTGGVRHQPCSRRPFRHGTPTIMYRLSQSKRCVSFFLMTVRMEQAPPLSSTTTFSCGALDTRDYATLLLRVRIPSGARASAVCHNFFLQAPSLTLSQACGSCACKTS